MKKIWGSIAVFFLFLVFLPYMILAVGTQTQKFKAFAEIKAGEYLKAEVRIRKIRPAFFSRIILSGFSIAPGTEQKFPYRVEVDKLIFKYSLSQLLTGRFTMPSSVLMKAPRLVMNSASSPYTFFEDINFKTRQNRQGLSSLELASGEIRYHIPTLGAAVVLRDIQGQFEPESGGKIRGKFGARLQGLVEGKVHIEGEIDPKTHERRVEFRVASAAAREGLLPPGNTVELKGRLANNDLTVDSLVIRAGRNTVEISGSILEFGADARAQLRMLIRQQTRQVQGFIDADFAKRIFKGNWQDKKSVDFEGSVLYENSKLTINEFHTSAYVRGRAFLDFISKTAGVYAEKGSRRIEIKADFSYKEIEMMLNLEHFLFSGLDLVYKGSLQLKPSAGEPSHLPLVFDGKFQTELFVLEYLPLNNLHGRFRLNAEGITDLDASWGDEFKMSGDMRFGGKAFEPDLTLRVSGYDLSQVKSFASKPLPKDLGGKLEGKMQMTGSLPRFQGNGAFTVSDGTLGKIEYDQAIIQLSGSAPYFKLIDSRIQKGRTVLRVAGALDISEPNIFSEVEIQSPENMVLWRGTEASLQELEGQVETERGPGLKNLSSISVSAGKGRRKTEEERPGGERSVEVGPKFQF